MFGSPASNEHAVSRMCGRLPFSLADYGYSWFSKEIAWPLRPFLWNRCVEVCLQLHADPEIVKADVPYHARQADSIGKLNDADRIRCKGLELSRGEMYHGVRYQPTLVR